MVKLVNVSKYYHTNGITSLGLHHISLSFERNEIVGIVGESGSGKSTLLNVICAMDNYDDGEIYFEGEETSYFSQDDMDRFRRKNVSFINQDYNIIDSYSVLENVALPLLIKGMSQKEADQKAKELIDRVHLTDRMNHKGSQLSGGEKQRCVIARALASDTPILACDEPTGNLDSQSGDDIIRLIQEVSKDKLVLLVTHNESQSDPILTRKIRLQDGEVIEDVKLKESNGSLSEIKKEEPKRNRFFEPLMALKNIKNAPKRNILTSLVFTVFSLIMIFSYLTAISFVTNANYYNTSHYVNTAHERIVAYDKDHKELDAAKLDSISGTKLKNAFYEDDIFEFEITNSNYISVSLSTVVPKNTEILRKNYGESSLDVTLICPSKSKYDEYGEQSYGYNHKVRFLKDWYNEIKVYVNSVGICNNLTYPLLLIRESGLESFQKLCYSYSDASIVAGKTTYSLDDGIYLRYDFDNPIYHEDKITPYQAALTYYGKTEIEVPKEIIVKLGGLYPITITDFTFSADIQPQNETRFEIIIYQLLVPSSTYEMTIYAENIDGAARTITDIGYKYIIPSRANRNETNTNMILANIYVITISIVGVALSIVVYAILSRVYISRQRDFSILRSLGIENKAMKHILSYEVCFIALFSSLLAIVLLLLTAVCVLDVKSLINSGGVFIYFFFVLFILLMAYLISVRFNRKLFESSVSKSLKEGRR